jgi:hypothetical protein
MTTKLPPETYIQFWEAADRQEFGILINTLPEDQLKLVNALYECRSTFGGYENLMIFQPKPEGQIFIAHKDAELPE